MSKRNGYDEEFKGNRKSPYDDMQDDSQEMDYEDDAMEQDDSAYAYSDEEYDEEQDDDEGGFLTSGKGKLLLGVIIALLLILLALLLFMVFGGGKKNDNTQQLPNGQEQQTVAEETAAPQFTKAPTSIVFAPSTQATEDPELIAQNEEPEHVQVTQAPVIVIENTPMPEPDPTATPLPIIMSNTPTPSPTPTATPTPSPSPSPTPSPKPTATPQLDIANGVTNRDAKLRESAASSGKIKQTIKKGETVTIHEAILDKDGKVWYALTVDEQATDGFMRDYVVDVDGELTVPTPTPKPTAAPKATAEPSNEMTVSLDDTAKEAKPAEDVIATGVTNRDANMRKVMNGKVLTTLRKGKAVEVLSVRTDKSGNVWYEVRQAGKDTVGFMRDYVVNLDDGVELEIPEPTAAPTAEPTEEPKEDVATLEEKGDEEKEEQPEKQQEQPVEAIGQAKTNRAANVREKPVSSAKLVRQLSKGNALNIFAKYEDDKGQIWYEVATESGKTKGFVRDYVINILNLDKTVEAQKYEEATVENEEKSTDAEQKDIVRESRFKFAGNKESKVFHTLSCDSLPSSSKNLVYMESRSYAVNTGYKPCENCNP